MINPFSPPSSRELAATHMFICFLFTCHSLWAGSHHHNLVMLSVIVCFKGISSALWSQFCMRVAIWHLIKPVAVGSHPHTGKFKFSSHGKNTSHDLENIHQITLPCCQSRLLCYPRLQIPVLRHYFAGVLNLCFSAQILPDVFL